VPGCEAIAIRQANQLVLLSYTLMVRFGARRRLGKMTLRI
jgi:hypothetical protein